MLSAGCLFTLAAFNWQLCCGAWDDKISILRGSSIFCCEDFHAQLLSAVSLRYTNAAISFPSQLLHGPGKGCCAGGRKHLPDVCVRVCWQEEMGLWACKVPTLGLGNCVKGFYKLFYSIRDWREKRKWPIHIAVIFAVEWGFAVSKEHGK